MMRLNYRLLDADMFSYYPAPKFWFRFKRRIGFNRRIGRIRGFGFRFWKLGFACHIGPGVYHNGRKFIIFIYDEYDDWLENGGW